MKREKGRKRHRVITECLFLWGYPDQIWRRPSVCAIVAPFNQQYPRRDSLSYHTAGKDSTGFQHASSDLPPGIEYTGPPWQRSTNSGATDAGESQCLVACPGDTSDTAPSYFKDGDVDVAGVAGGGVSARPTPRETPDRRPSDMPGMSCTP